MSARDGVNLTLKIVGLAGLTATVVVAPNAVQGLAKLLKKPQPIDNYERILRNLKRQRLMIITRQNDEIHFNLTPAGALRLQSLIIEELDIPVPKTWDRSWRLITFDIPLKLSRERQRFTAQLHSRGFLMLQRSLWVYPFPCFEQVEKLAGHYNVLRYCSFMEVTRFDPLATKRLVSHFANLIA